MNLLGKIIQLYKRTFWSLEKQALSAGVAMGSNNFIASHFWSSEPYLISIGSHCALTRGTKIFTHGGGRAVRHLEPHFDCFGKVVLGDYVYVGNNALIMPGVTVGSHVLIAAGSVVTKSVPSDVVVGGNPAKVLCSIEEYYDRNKKYNLGTKGLSGFQKKKIILETDESKLIAKKTMSYMK